MHLKKGKKINPSRRLVWTCGVISIISMIEHFGGKGIWSIQNFQMPKSEVNLSHWLKKGCGS
jgi:hypothetical protein